MALVNFVVIFYFAAKFFEFVSCSSGPLEQPLHSPKAASPRLPISQNEKLLSLISICVAASGEQSQHKKDLVIEMKLKKVCNEFIISGRRFFKNLIEEKTFLKAQMVNFYINMYIF